VRKHVQSFRQIRTEINSKPQQQQQQQHKDAAQTASILQMAESLLRNDFEAAIHLKLWDDLEKIVEVSL